MARLTEKDWKPIGESLTNAAAGIGGALYQKGQNEEQKKVLGDLLDYRALNQSDWDVSDIPSYYSLKKEHPDWSPTQILGELQNQGKAKKKEKSEPYNILGKGGYGNVSDIMSGKDMDMIGQSTKSKAPEIQNILGGIGNKPSSPSSSFSPSGIDDYLKTIKNYDLE